MDADTDLVYPPTLDAPLNISLPDSEKSKQADRM